MIRGEGASLEVFWVLRGEAVPYMPGFHAFPGGKVDAQDLELEIDGADSEFERAARACAIREAFEETGVLIGLEGGNGAEANLGAGEFSHLEIDRTELLDGRVTFPALARRRGWRFRADAFTPAGRWTTPPFASARFDTCFYLARVPGSQEPNIRPGELESGEWIKPLAGLDRYRHGDAVFAAPILWTLIALAEGDDGLAERLVAAPERSRQPVRRIELSWGIVLHPMPTRPLPPATHTNAYLIGEKELVLLDPGSGDPAALEELFTLMDHLASEGRRPKMVVLTHHHPDHVGGLDEVRTRYRIPVAAHPECAKHFRIDVALGDGERIPLAPGIRPWDLQVVHTPGHTRDHLCLLHGSSGSVFCGDHIAGAGTVVIDPPDGDMHAYLDSLEKLLELSPRVLYPAHGSPRGGAERRLRELIAHRLEREWKVAQALSETPAGIAYLVPIVYADTPKELWKWAERSLLAHLIKLEAEGRARRAGERWRSA
jgi:ribonuclease/clavin/mitogillin